jgi:hypothetical protein
MAILGRQSKGDGTYVDSKWRKTNDFIRTVRRP